MSPEPGSDSGVSSPETVAASPENKNENNPGSSPQPPATAVTTPTAENDFKTIIPPPLQPTLVHQPAHQTSSQSSQQKHSQHQQHSVSRDQHNVSFSNIPQQGPPPPLQKCPDVKEDAESKKAKQKTKELYHRDIEKRRRDRINRSLWMLKDLIPTAKQTHEDRKSLGTRSSRLEKAELLELAVAYLQKLKPGHEGSSHINVAGRGRASSSSHASRESSAVIQSNKVIAESAKEIFMAGYKKAIQETADHLVNNDVITPNQKADYLDSIDLRIVNIPDIFLTRPKPTTSVAGDDKQSMMLYGTESVGGDTESKPGDMPSLIARENVTNEHSDGVTWSGDDSSKDLSGMPRFNPSSSIDGDSSSLSPPSSNTSDKENEGPFPNALTTNAGETNMPILLPAYVLHANRSHYVPVVLPQDVVIGSYLMSMGFPSTLRQEMPSELISKPNTERNGSDRKRVKIDDSSSDMGYYSNGNGNTDSPPNSHPLPTFIPGKGLKRAQQECTRPDCKECSMMRPPPLTSSDRAPPQLSGPQHVDNTRPFIPHRVKTPIGNEKEPSNNDNNGNYMPNYRSAGLVEPDHPFRPDFITNPFARSLSSSILKNNNNQELISDALKEAQDRGFRFPTLTKVPVSGAL